MHFDRTANTFQSVLFVLLSSGLVLMGCSRQAPPPPRVPQVSVVTIQPQKITLTSHRQDVAPTVSLKSGHKLAA